MERGDGGRGVRGGSDGGRGVRGGSDGGRGERGGSDRDWRRVMVVGVGGSDGWWGWGRVMEGGSNGGKMSDGGGEPLSSLTWAHHRPCPFLGASHPSCKFVFVVGGGSSSFVAVVVGGHGRQWRVMSWSVGSWPVLFDAPQIPAGMHQFRRIPQESTGIHWNGTRIQWNGTGIQWNEPGFHWIVTEGTCISACKYKCVYINRLCSLSVSLSLSRYTLPFLGQISYNTMIVALSLTFLTILKSSYLVLLSWGKMQKG